MNPDEKIQSAQTAWDVCRQFLPADMLGTIRVMAGDPKNAPKFDFRGVRLRVQPKDKTPPDFWKGWAWYELKVGFDKTQERPGLNVGSIAFIFPKGNGDERYVQPVLKILKKSAQSLGSDFFVPDSAQGTMISLKRTYRGCSKFPECEAGRDFANLIAATLPLLKQV